MIYWLGWFPQSLSLSTSKDAAIVLLVLENPMNVSTVYFPMLWGDGIQLCAPYSLS